MRSRSWILFVGPCLVIGGLAAFQVIDGLVWLESVRRSQRAEFIAEVSREHDELVRNLRGLYETGRQHTRHLARTPAIRTLLSGPALAAPPRAELDAFTLPYLLSFEHLDRVVLADAEGRELYRCERMGGGAGSLPTPRLDRIEPSLFHSLVEQLDHGDVAVAPVQRETERVEVRAADREVLYYLARVPEVAQPAYVLLTVYASSLLAPIRSLRPVPGSRSALVDDGGLHWLDDDTESPPPARPASNRPASNRPESPWPIETALRAEREAHSLLETEHGVAWRGVVDSEPGVSLITVIPADEVAARVSPWERGGAGAIASFGIALVLLGALFVSVLAMNRRAWRHREADRTAQASRAEANRLRTLIEHSADYILVVDAGRGQIREANEAARRALGLGEDDSTAPPAIEEILDRSRHEPLFAAIDQAGREVGVPVSSGSFTLSAADGAELSVDVRCVGFDFEDGPSVLIAFRDRTREREVERQLIIGDRLGSLGLLTAGLAHEINNPLEGIGNYLSLLARPDLPADKRERYLGQVGEGFARIRDLMRDLLRFGRNEGRTGATDLRAVVERSLRLAGMSGKFRDIDITCDGLDAPLALHANAGQLEQLFLNLLINSANAIDGTGRISIRVSRPSDHTAPLVVVVEDDGPGFPETILHRVFDPFFTTSNGSGLGLSIAYGIVEAHGGTLTAANRREGGARLTLTLPTKPNRPT